MNFGVSTFHVARADIAVDPVTLIAEGLVIGRSKTCDVLLNHPSVSRSHAGIRQLDKDFYVFNLSPTNATTLNGKLVEAPQVLVSGDRLQIGPFFVAIERDRESLSLTVSLQVGIHIGELGARAHEVKEVPTPASDSGKQRPTERLTTSITPLAAPAVEALEVFWQKRQREAGKVERLSPLHPRGERKLGKARYNWKPTSDLARRRTGGIFIWSVLLVAMLSIGAAYFYASAYSPAPVSNPHTRSQFAFTPAVAREPNANSCMSCHAPTRSMEASCAACHQTEIFASHSMPAHVQAGITCTTCHAEHRGTDFRPRLAALASCAECHNDRNKNLYNGKSVHTAHNNSFGYPVENGQWTWEGMDDETWAGKFAQLNASSANADSQDNSSAQIATAQLAGVSQNERRSIQFHQIHLHRLRAVDGLAGNSDGEVSCSTCHKQSFPVDRETPRTTCAACHNGKQEVATGITLIKSDAANCTSCHIQHRADRRHWNPSLLTDRSGVIQQTPTTTPPQGFTKEQVKSETKQTNTADPVTERTRLNDGLVHSSARRINLPRSF